MKTYIWALLAVACSPALLSAQEAADLQTPQARASYALGHKIGSDFKSQQIVIDPEVLMRGLQDALAGIPAALDEKQRIEALNALSREVEGRLQMMQNHRAEKNIWKGRAFLNKNRQQPGVISSISGLQYKVLAPGTGRRPGPQDRVKVHYRGRLIDGTEFDSSYKRGQPTVFPVQGVIPGWREALQMMRPGAKWQLFIPPRLAYGEKGSGAIEPNATLIFELELLEVL